jgi:hypothetical protein
MANASCPSCGGQGGILGTLGFLRHFRCRDCGAEFSRQIRRRVRKVAPLPRAKVRWAKRGGRLYGKYKSFSAVVWDQHGSVDRPMAHLYQFRVTNRKGAWVSQGNASRLDNAMRYVEEAMKGVAGNPGQRRNDSTVVAQDPKGHVHTLTTFKGKGSSFGAKMHVSQIRRRAAHGGDFFTGWKAGYAVLKNRCLKNGSRNCSNCCRNGKSRYRKNRALDTAWTGKKADYVSRRGNFGPAPHSELSMHTGAAGATITRFALFSDANRWPWVTWAHIQTSTGQVLDGTPGEVLPTSVRRKLGGFGNEKMPMAARLKR